ncbi:MAG: ORF6N domain-containing protein [Coriobacteriales bacterium]|nr:ORF6N domain-containing protein [Coriobacteriales bacterium]
MTDELTNTNTEIISQPQEEDIKSLILTIRGIQVLLDSDVARLYGYETKAINLAAKRNADRFPPEFRFQLTDDELDHILRFQTETSNNVSTAASEKRGGRRYLPYAYSEHGVIALAGVLRNKVAVQVSTGIVRAFVEMRRFISAHRDVFARLVSIDNKLVNIDDRLLEHEQKFNEVFDLLQQPQAVKQLIFYKGELYDAQSKLIEFIQEAKTSLVIVDNYANGAVLDMLAEKQTGVDVTVITAKPDMISRQRQQAYTAQYGALKIVENHDFHDRFIIVDDKDVYAVGASLKDAGRKCFEVSKNEDTARFLAYVQSVIA